MRVADPSRASYLSRKLGAKLRRMREQAGHTLDTAAVELDKTRSALHRVETGETKADVHLVRTMMDLYDCYDEDLLEETRKAAKPPWFRAFGVKGSGKILGVETAATEASEYSVQVIPGLLQTESYMRALFMARRNRRTDPEVSVRIRLARQHRLSAEDNPLRCVAVIDEVALLRPVGGPDVMREQLEHLLVMAALPTVILRVLPLACGAHHVMPGPFLLFGFPDPEDPGYVYIEHLNGGLHSDDIEDVKNARLALEEVQSSALGPTDSIALIERLLEAPPWTFRC
ncbi:MAG: helix-turn-helix transcriptional regulator [Kibdelosporangium sp.]